MLNVYDHQHIFSRLTTKLMSYALHARKSAVAIASGKRRFPVHRHQIATHKRLQKKPCASRAERSGVATNERQRQCPFSVHPVASLLSYSLDFLASSSAPVHSLLN